MPKSLIFIGNSRNPDGTYQLVTADDGSKFYIRAIVHAGDLGAALDKAGDYVKHGGDVVMNSHPADTNQ